MRGNGWVFHFSNQFLAHKLHDSTFWAGAMSWWRIKTLGQSLGLFLGTASIFLHNKLGWLFGLVGRIQREQYPWHRRKWWALSSFVISKCELSWVVGTFPLQTSSFTFGITFKAPRSITSDNFTQNSMLIRCSKNRSLIFATRPRHTHVFSAPQLPHNWR